MKRLLTALLDLMEFIRTARLRRRERKRRAMLRRLRRLLADRQHPADEPEDGRKGGPR